jgi:hypothetical protein
LLSGILSERSMLADMKPILALGMRRMAAKMGGKNHLDEAPLQRASTFSKRTVIVTDLKSESCA